MTAEYNLYKAKVQKWTAGGQQGASPESDYPEVNDGVRIYAVDMGRVQSHPRKRGGNPCEGSAGYNGGLLREAP